MFTFIALAIMGFASSCSTSKKNDNSYVPGGKISAHDTIPIFTLQTGPCFGSCSVYAFSMFSGARGTLEKKRFLPGLGKYEMQLDEATFMSFIRELDKAKMMDMPDEYPSYIEDMPMTTVTYKIGDTYKTVKGKENLPVSLRSVQDQVELLMKSPGWVLTEAIEQDQVEQDQQKEYIMSEIRVVPMDGVALPRWIKRYENEGLRLLKRLDEDKNIWLFTWDQDKIKPHKFLSILNKDIDVKSAEFHYTSKTP